jgi:hypothetical protein
MNAGKSATFQTGIPPETSFFCAGKSAAGEQACLKFPWNAAVELPCGAKFPTRAADISRTGCYIDTLNPTTRRLGNPPAHHAPPGNFRNSCPRGLRQPRIGHGRGLWRWAAEQGTVLDCWLAETAMEC